MSQDNIIYIGKKPLMSYVTACITVMNSRRHGGVVTLAARGKAISRVVDVIEVLKRFRNYEIEDVEFGTDVIKQDGEERNISSIRVSCRPTR